MYTELDFRAASMNVQSVLWALAFLVYGTDFRDGKTKFSTLSSTVVVLMAVVEWVESRMCTQTRVYHSPPSFLRQLSFTETAAC